MIYLALVESLNLLFASCLPFILFCLWQSQNITVSQISIKALIYSAYLPRLSYLYKIKCRSSVLHGYLIKGMPNVAVDHMHRFRVAPEVVWNVLE